MRHTRFTSWKSCHCFLVPGKCSLGCGAEGSFQGRVGKRQKFPCISLNHAKNSLNALAAPRSHVYGMGGAWGRGGTGKTPMHFKTRAAGTSGLVGVRRGTLAAVVSYQDGGKLGVLNSCVIATACDTQRQDSDFCGSSRLGIKREPWIGAVRARIFRESRLRISRRNVQSELLGCCRLPTLPSAVSALDPGGGRGLTEEVSERCGGD